MFYHHILLQGLFAWFSSRKSATRRDKWGKNSIKFHRIWWAGHLLKFHLPNHTHLPPTLSFWRIISCNRTHPSHYLSHAQSKFKMINFHISNCLHITAWHFTLLNQAWKLFHLCFSSARLNSRWLVIKSEAEKKQRGDKNSPHHLSILATFYYFKQQRLIFEFTNSDTNGRSHHCQSMCRLYLPGIQM